MTKQKASQRKAEWRPSRRPPTSRRRETSCVLTASCASSTAPAPTKRCLSLRSGGFGSERCQNLDLGQRFSRLDQLPLPACPRKDKMSRVRFPT
eukprot:1656964-Rhodomonas_salina.1